MIAAGIGCKRGAPASDIEAAIRAVLARAQIGVDTLDVIATIEAKRAEAGVRAVAEKFGVHLIIVPQLELTAASDRVETHSERATTLAGVGSVAEAAALAATGPTGKLIVARVIVGAATCALAASAELSLPCKERVGSPKAIQGGGARTGTENDPHPAADGRRPPPSGGRKGAAP